MKFKEFHMSFRISREEFERIVGESLDALPPAVAERINNVAIFVEDWPTKEQLGKSKAQFTLFGLFEGHAQGRGLYFGPVLPDRITIFRGPILDVCGSEEECRRQIESTLRHEIAHHFGSDEPGARKAGRIKPKKR